MADEATLSEESGLNSIRFVVDPSINVSQGTLMFISGDHAVGKSSTAQPYAGVAAADHKANEGEVEMAVHVPGRGNVFDMTNTGVTILGELVRLSGTNLVGGVKKNLQISTGQIVGIALEGGSDSEIIRVLT